MSVTGLIRGHGAPTNRAGTAVMCRWHIKPSAEWLPVLRSEVAEFAQRSGLPPDEIDAALLIVNELVSNVIDHARSAARVTVRLTNSTVRIFVSDQSPAEPVLRPYNRHALRGRGIRIVSSLARRWGYSRHGVGKTVWASMDRAPC
jgi:anti-sigma regulatory factor (Ser/Thr protein kinase)